MNIIFAGTPDFAAQILKGLLKAGLNIVACYSQPDRPKGRGKILSPTPVKQIANEFNIPVYQPLNFKSEETLKELNSLQPDLMIVVAYGLLLPQKVLDIPTHGCINIHGSILPKYRGAAPIQHSILNGETETGITIFQIDKGLDSGDILGVYKCPISNTDTTKTMLEKFVPISIDASCDIVNKIQTNNVSKTKQNHSKASLAPKIHKDDALINWNEEAITIDRKIRAFYPWPVAYFKVNDINVKIIEAHIEQKNEKLDRAVTAVKPTSSDEQETSKLLNTNSKSLQQNIKHLNDSTEKASIDQITNNNIGKILNIDKNGLIIAAKNGKINITKMQFPGSKILDIKDVINAPKYMQIFKY